MERESRYRGILREMDPAYSTRPCASHSRGSRPGPKPRKRLGSRPALTHRTTGVSVEEQEAAGTVLDLVRALTNLRTEHPAYANGELGSILTDSAEWMVFEKVGGQDRYLVLINTGHAQSRSHRIQ